MHETVTTECSSCISGLYQPENAKPSVQCQFCTLGQASLDASTACEPCINGQYQENQVTKTYGCL